MKTKRAQHIRRNDVLEVNGAKVWGVHVEDGIVEVVARDDHTGLRQYTFAVDDEIEVHGEWTREELNEVIERHFPRRLGTFYSEESNNLAAVEDYAGNMWRVWADGDTQEYKA